MYDECIDAVPLIISSCYAHNKEQFTKAANYYKRENNKQFANQMKQCANEESRKEYAEWERYHTLNAFGKFLYNLTH